MTIATKLHAFRELAAKCFRLPRGPRTLSPARAKLQVTWGDPRLGHIPWEEPLRGGDEGTITLSEDVQ